MIDDDLTNYRVKIEIQMINYLNSLCQDCGLRRNDQIMLQKWSESKYQNQNYSNSKESVALSEAMSSIKSRLLHLIDKIEGVHYKSISVLSRFFTLTSVMHSMISAESLFVFS